MVEVYQYIMSLGLKPVYTFVGLLAAYVAHKYREELLIAWNVKGLFIKDNLELHTLFLVLSELRNEKIPNIEIEDDPLKKQCLTIFLRNKIDCIESHSRDIIKSKSYRKSSQTFFNYIMTDLQKILKDYTEETVEDYLKIGLSLEEAEIVVKKWNNVHEQLVVNLRDEIEHIFLSNQVRSNSMKLIIIFNLYSMALKNTFDTDFKMFLDMNGYFKRITLNK